MVHHRFTVLKEELEGTYDSKTEDDMIQLYPVCGSLPYDADYRRGISSTR